MKPSEETLTKVARYIIRKGKRQAIKNLESWLNSYDRQESCPFGQPGGPTYRIQGKDQRYATCPCLLIWPQLREVSYNYIQGKEAPEISTIFDSFCPCCTTKEYCKEKKVEIDPTKHLTPEEILSTATSLLHIIEKTKRL